MLHKQNEVDTHLSDPNCSDTSLKDSLLKQTSQDTSETQDELKRFLFQKKNATIEYKNQTCYVHKEISFQRSYYNADDNKKHHTKLIYQEEIKLIINQIT